MWYRDRCEVAPCIKRVVLQRHFPIVNIIGDTLEGVVMKKCKGCLEMLPYGSYTPSKNLKDGYENKCRECRRSARKTIKNKCEQCEVEFKTANKDAKYCSNECIANSRIVRVKKKCKECKDKYEVVPSRKGTSSFCSQQCKIAFQTKLTGELNPNYARINHNCDGCSKAIQIKPSTKENQKYVFCGHDCYKKHIGKYFTGENNNFYSEPVACNCDACGREFLKKPHLVKGINYCSRECLGIGLTIRNKELSDNLRVEVKCSNCNKLHKVIPSNLRNRKVFYCSRECMDLHYNQTFQQGKNHPRWNPDLTNEERELNRNIPGYAQWRSDVYERDNHTCVACDKKSSGNLNAHHLYSYSTHKELRTDVNNGITLCTTCHYEFHNDYGYFENTNEEFEEFLISKHANPEPSILEII